MNRRRFLASVLALAATSCTGRARRAPVSRHAIGIDPGKPGADHTVLVEQVGNVRYTRIVVHADDPDRWVMEMLDKNTGKWRSQSA